MSVDRDINLSQVDLLNPEQVTRLESHWITTFEQFLLLGASEKRRQSGAEILGMELTNFDSLIDKFTSMAPELAASAVSYPYEDFLGCLAPLESLPVSVLPPETVSAEELPEEVNLAPKMSKVRDQGRRGTCVAHGCTALREYLMGSADMSEQFLYWKCKELDDYHGEGTYLSIGFKAMYEAGQCREQTWPYNPNPVDGNEGQGPPPEGAVQEALNYRISKIYQIVRGMGAQADADVYKQFLAADKPLPVPIAVPLFESFFNQSTRRTGRVVMPLPGDDISGGHAMCIVGYKDDPAVPGGGFFIVRNSWGEGWAYKNEYGAGHALIPYKYMEEYCWEAFTAEADDVVSTATVTVSEEKETPTVTINVSIEEQKEEPLITVPKGSGFTQFGGVEALSKVYCASCGKKIITSLDVAGECKDSSCEGTVCHTCWTIKGLRYCTDHRK
jgi:hypothetical protein